MDEQEKLIDLNTAETSELTTLPGVGPTMADRISAERPFTTLDDLQRVSGVGPTLLDRIASYVTLSESDEEDKAKQTPKEASGAQTEPDEVEILDMAPEPESEPQVEELLIAAEEAAEDTAEEVLADTVPTEEAPVAAAMPTEEEKAKGSPPPRVRPKGQAQEIRSAGVWGISCLNGCFSFFLSIIVILGVLAMINDGLKYARYNDFLSLKYGVNNLDAQTIEMQQDLLSMQSRMDNLESFSGHVTEVQGEVDRLSQDFGEVIEQASQLVENMETLSSQLDDLENQTMELQINTQAFEKFLDGLRDLLIGPEEP